MQIGFWFLVIFIFYLFLFFVLFCFVFLLFCVAAGGDFFNSFLINLATQELDYWSN